MLLINLKQEYIYLTVFFVICVSLSAFLLLLSYSLSRKKKNDAEKLSAYECGFDPFGTGVSSFEVRFYVVGILFIIFDLEIIFLYPWAVQFGTLGAPGCFAVLIFLIILTVGFIYEWQMGALDWSKSISKKRHNPQEYDCKVPSALLKVATESSVPRVKVIGWPSRPVVSITPPNVEWPGGRSPSRVFGKFIKREWVAFLEDPWNEILAATVVFLYFAQTYLLFWGLLGILPIVFFLLITASVKYGRPAPLLGVFTAGLIGGFTFLSNIYARAIWDCWALSTHFESHPYLDNPFWGKLVWSATAENNYIFWSFSVMPAEFYHADYIIKDLYTLYVQWYLLILLSFFLFVTLPYLILFAARESINLTEFPIIILFAAFFMLFLISSFNFFGAYVSLEGLTFSLYILAGMDYNSQNTLESGMKYFCLGALSSGFLLFGVALIFIITKTLDFSELKFLFNSLKDMPLILSFALIFVFFGFWFKLSVFPCHAWTPDVYEGVLTPVTFFLATVVKFSVFAFFVRILFFLLGSQVFLFFWQPLFLFVATGSIIFGAFGALLQTGLKRFAGYTSINQMGYLLLGVSSGTSVGLQASFLYLFFYVAMGFSFFSVIMYLQRFDTGEDVLFINELRGFAQDNRNLSFFLALILFSMAGIPPLAGFFGKVFLFFSVYQAGNHSLVILGLTVNVISTFYYLRIIKCLFFEDVNVNFPVVFAPNIDAGYWFSPLFFCAALFLVASPFFLDSLLSQVDTLVSVARYVQVWQW